MKEFMSKQLQFLDISHITMEVALKTLGISLALTLLISLVYIFTHRKSGFPSSMIVSILLMGPIASIIVVCIGSNLARAISIGGGLALIRYRNTIEDPRDLVYLFLSLATGMACGTGFIGYAIIAISLILIVLIIANVTRFDSFGGNTMKLSIIIPEDLDFYGVFDPVLKKYCRSFSLLRIKTTDYGTLAELQYRIKLKNIAEQKKLIDEVRERNGNLTVTLVRKATDNY
ncbi:MAG: DUF4956 domain-containing protein [Ruminococcaceae bacterium]|nr:DUF4956 domain-containing protein [Oscillospiraceae bacterium]